MNESGAPVAAGAPGAPVTDVHNRRKPLPREFYARDTVSVAHDLLGATLVRRVDGHTMSGIISETEAYGHTDDPASHAYRKATQRNKIMFGPVGMSYVYFTYGMHYCFNATARDPEVAGAGAVLIRGLIPESGIGRMMRNRNTKDASILADGPAKLAQAMQIASNQYGEDLTKRARLYITGNPEYDVVRQQGIVRSPRIGIKEASDRLWNFKIVPRTRAVRVK